MFSAPGCHGNPDHSFSHPFVQVILFIYPQDNNTPFTSNFPLGTFYFSVPLRKQNWKCYLCFVKVRTVFDLRPCLHITFPVSVAFLACILIINYSFLYRTSPLLALPGCGNVFGRAVLPGGVLHSPLSWSAQTWAHSGSGPKFQPPTFPPSCCLWHVGNIHHVCWWVSNMWSILCQ